MKHGFTVVIIPLVILIVIGIGVAAAYVSTPTPSVQPTPKASLTPKRTPTPTLKPERSWTNSERELKAVLVDEDIVLIYNNEKEVVATVSRNNVIDKVTNYEKSETDDLYLDVVGWNKEGSTLWGDMLFPPIYPALYWEYNIDAKRLVVYDKFHEVEDSFGPLPGTLNMERRVYVYRDKPISFSVGELDSWHETHDTYSLFLYNLVTHKSTKIDTFPGNYPDEGGMTGVEMRWASDNELVYKAPEGERNFFLRDDVSQ